MNYADIKYNDIANGIGVCLSYWTQGCPFHCKGCHNPDTWDFEGGKVDTEENIINTIITKISDNNIIRNFSILGGEPLCDDNFDFVSELVNSVREVYPNILIFVWTGNIYESLIEKEKYKDFLYKIDYLIDGIYIEKQRDITLFLRGSSNQRVIDIKKTLENNEIITVEEI